MTNRNLAIGEGLKFPLDLITDRGMILATTGAGKTFLMRVIAEEALDAGQQVVILDPKGDFWGLRSSENGKEPGYPIPVFGGEHADLPLEEGSGQFIAELIVNERLSAILDLSLFSKTKMNQWATDFAEALYHRNREAMLFLVDEVHTFAPQKFKGREQILGAFTDVWGKGRKRGIGVLGASQRSALVNKDVLDLTGTMYFLRTSGPRDRKVVEDWLDYNSPPDVMKEILESLPGLENGEIWVYSPHTFKVLKRGKVRYTKTFDSSATPKPGQAIRRPKTLAEIDVGSVTEQMSSAIERAKADDPKELRKQIAQLKRELQSRPTETTVQEVEKIVEVPVPLLEPQETQRIVSVLGDIQNATEKLGRLSDDFSDRLGKVSHAPRPEPRRPVAPRPRPVAPRPAPRREVVPDGELKLKAGARRMLEVLAGAPMKVTRPQLASLAKMKRTGGAFSAYFSTLKTNGLIVETNGIIELTDEGAARVGTDFHVPTTTDEVLAMWASKLKAGARRMLSVLVEVYPATMTKQELAESVEMEVQGGAFSTYLSTLRTNGLIVVSGDISANPETLLL